MRLISIIVGGRPYLDRMRLLFALDPYVEEHVIITREETETPVLANTRIIRPRRKLGPLFWPWAGMEAVRTIRQSGPGEKWLVSEHFWCFASLLPRLLLRKRVKVAVALYAPNRSLFLDKAWNVDRFALPLSQEQTRYYSRRYRNNMLLDRLAIRFADAMIVNSETIREDILQLSPGKNVIVMPTSATLPQPGTPAGDCPHFCDRTSEKWGRSPSGVTFLYVGLMQPRKGIGLLLHAFQQHSRSRPMDRLVLVGRQIAVDRPWFERLMATYGPSCRITYLPHMDAAQLARQYQEADVFVFPSFYEGSPRVVKEAMAHGCPVIASDIPGTRLVDADGAAVQYFAPGDAEGLIRLMGQLAADPDRRAALRQRSEAVVADFTHERVAERLARAYREILGGFSTIPTSTLARRASEGSLARAAG